MVEGCTLAMGVQLVPKIMKRIMKRIEKEVQRGED